REGRGPNEDSCPRIAKCVLRGSHKCRLIEPLGGRAVADTSTRDSARPHSEYSDVGGVAAPGDRQRVAGCVRNGDRRQRPSSEYHVCDTFLIHEPASVTHRQVHDGVELELFRNVTLRTIEKVRIPGINDGSGTDLLRPHEGGLKY